MDTSLPAFQRYLAGLKASSTARKYPAYARFFLEFVRESGYESLSELPSGILSEFASLLGNEGLGPSTIRVRVYAAVKYLDWVRSRGGNVPVLVKPELPKVQTRVRDILSPDDIAAYFRQVNMDLSEPIRTATMLLPCCGLRANEMATLRLGDIHKARVKMRKKKERYKTTLFLKVRGKGDKERSVPLMEEGVEILTGYLMGWRRDRPGDWLFPSPGGKYPSDAVKKGARHISTRSIRGGVQRVRENMTMEFTPHTMRRTYITMLYRKGVDLKTLAAIAGHASIQTTINHYIATDPMDAVRALNEVGDSLIED